MAEDQGQEKTEQPTQRRFEKAAEEGQTAQSADFSSGLLVLGGTIFFLIAGSTFYRKLTAGIAKGLSAESVLDFEYDHLGEKTATMTNQVLWELMMLVGPLVLVTVSLAILNSAIVSGIRITYKPLSPKWDKLDPIKGFQKIFSIRAVIRGVTAVAKVAVMSTVVYWMLIGATSRIAASCGLTILEIVGSGWELTLQISLAVAASMVMIGLADLGFQKWKHLQDLKMTKKELKDEYKESEGDPHQKARLRKLQREVSTRTMMNDVKKADVVITNPTHLAIALRFDRSKGGAPVVLAKGADAVAMKIIEIAKENKVPVVERKPVARALYQIVEVGDEIPLELYQAVAEILAYVSRNRSIINR